MLQQAMFSQDDLRLYPIQYTVRHKSVDSFKIGEYVFLKSNPEVRLIVVSLNTKDNLVLIKLEFTEDYYEFSPECILQYTQSSLIDLYGLNLVMN